MHTVVLDTNLIIAGRWNPKSSSHRLLDMVVEGKLKAVYTPEIKDENLFILQKVKPPKDFMDKIFKYYNSEHCRLVHPKKRVNVCEDKSDNRYLEAALAGKAGYVVSNDHHLLEVGEYEGIKVVRPGEFLRIVGV